MSPQQLQAWTGAALGLAQAGVQVAGLIHGWVGQAHPELTEAQVQEAALLILNDSATRAALAAQAAG